MDRRKFLQLVPFIPSAIAGLAALPKPYSGEVGQLYGVKVMESSVIPLYHADVLKKQLYPNLYFSQFGTHRTIPKNYGGYVRIPRLDKCTNSSQAKAP
jgi:hypothetical protein